MMGKNDKDPNHRERARIFFRSILMIEKGLFTTNSRSGRKISNAQFNIDQLNLCRVKAVELLAQSLEGKNEQAEETETLN